MGEAQGRLKRSVAYVSEDLANVAVSPLHLGYRFPDSYLACALAWRRLGRWSDFQSVVYPDLLQYAVDPTGQSALSQEPKFLWTHWEAGPPPSFWQPLSLIILQLPKGHLAFAY
jgi:hypothetical protein